MKVSQLMRPELSTCSPADTLQAAAAVLLRSPDGTLPVVDEHGRVVGILSDRDVCRAACAHDRPLSRIRVRHAMTGGVVYSCSPENDIADVERTMIEHRVRRLPVVDHHGRLLGVVSHADLIRAAARHDGGLTCQEVVETLAAIGAPPGPGDPF